ncbi:uncharacterized protein LOC108603837 [Drosophila busckii]|uniref:uncharacterized protein LOC108603837 n=1 Tax=Drosophila busckii TaxID=30019 RepID=UPI00083F115F|nr:uncharacterized protein LOC108603837 [Drosophila busckii]
MDLYIRVLTLLLLLSGLFLATKGACNVCQPHNDAACLNQTAYQLCFGSGQPSAAQTFVCPDGLVCSDKPTVCFQRSEIPASCGDTDSCGICNLNNVFACTSRTTFAFCFGATTPTTVNGTCPVDKFCDASSVNICVSKATDDSIICHVE